MEKTKNQIKSVILSIDSTDNQKTIVGIDINHKKDNIIKKTSVWTSQVLLPAIEELLVKNNLSLGDLTQIKVKRGPGSFTGIRVGLSVANALGKLLDIPINGRKNKIVVPLYD